MENNEGQNLFELFKNLGETVSLNKGITEKMIINGIKDDNAQQRIILSACINFMTHILVEFTMRSLLVNDANNLLKDKIASFAKSNADNIDFALEMLKKNKEKLLPQSISEIDIDSDIFKEFCKIPIFIPSENFILFSAIHLIILYYKHTDIAEGNIYFQWNYGLLKKTNINDYEGFEDQYYRQKEHNKRNIFLDNPSSYYNELEKEFSISLSNVSKSKNNSLWNIFELFGYAMHDFINNERKTKDSSGLFGNNDNVNLIHLLTEGNINVLSPNQKTDLFVSTVLINKLNEKQLSDLMLFHKHISDVILDILYLDNLLKSYFRMLAIAVQTSDIQHVTNYMRIIDELKTWLYNKGTVSDNSEAMLPIIRADEESLHLLILWRKYIKEINSGIKILKNAYLLKTKSPQQVNAMRLYLAGNPDEFIDVTTWNEFYTKYNFQLKEFFPTISDDELKETWLYSAVALFCCMPEQHGFDIDNLTPRTNITDKWLSKFANSVKLIKANNIFSVMSIVVYNGDILIESKGKNTSFYQGISKNDSPKSAWQKTVKDLIKTIKVHYTSPQKPNNYDLLTVHLLMWIAAQKNNFLIADNILASINQFTLSHLNIVYSDIICSDNISSCTQNAKRVNDAIRTVTSEIMNKIKQTIRDNEFFKNFCDSIDDA